MLSTLSAYPRRQPWPGCWRNWASPSISCGPSTRGRPAWPGAARPGWPRSSPTPGPARRSTGTCTGTWRPPGTPAALSWRSCRRSPNRSSWPTSMTGSPTPLSPGPESRRSSPIRPWSERRIWTGISSAPRRAPPGTPGSSCTIPDPSPSPSPLSSASTWPGCLRPSCWPWPAADCAGRLWWAQAGTTPGRAGCNGSAGAVGGAGAHSRRSRCSSRWLSSWQP